jgi:hypothetical protein
LIIPTSVRLLPAVDLSKLGVVDSGSTPHSTDEVWTDGGLRLLPRDEKFFELFGGLSGYLTEGAQLLRGILQDPYDLGIRLEQVQAVEHKADRTTHAIITKLNQSFIRPLTARTFTGWRLHSMMCWTTPTRPHTAWCSTKSPSRLQLLPNWPA